jgi:hypothetical protein
MDGKRPFFARRSGLEGWRDPVPGQELVEAAYGMAVGHALEHVLQVSVGLAVVELSGADQRADDGPAVGAAIGPGEKMVFAAKGNHPVILPISGQRSRSTIAGIRCMDVVSCVYRKFDSRSTRRMNGVSS